MWGERINKKTQRILLQKRRVSLGSFFNRAYVNVGSEPGPQICVTFLCKVGCKLGAFQITW
ncbi:MAG: hypothetical protein EBX50_20500, partial [Chitinophagia bacterium]|nr:hypothetical protein [Chitinophagia bacterium]